MNLESWPQSSVKTVKNQSVLMEMDWSLNGNSAKLQQKKGILEQSNEQTLFSLGCDLQSSPRKMMNLYYGIKYSRKADLD